MAQLNLLRPESTPSVRYTEDLANKTREDLGQDRPSRSQARMVQWLNDVCSEIEGGSNLELQLERLMRGLYALREDRSAEEWRALCANTLVPHRIREVLHQCPYTAHCFAHPRGYAGDADLIDFLYGEPSADDTLGNAIFRYWHRLPGAVSVRERRDLLGACIDSICAERPGANILSVACGHLREAECSKALAQGRVGQLLAFDQDAESLAVVSRKHSGNVVKPVNGSVRQLLARKRKELGEQDFIYSAGLYDYLPAPVAARLTSRLFEMLRPGGTLLVANFAPFPLEVGYIEAYMDWFLIYRNEGEVRAFADEIEPNAIASTEMFRDSPGHVIYFSLTRR